VLVRQRLDVPLVDEAALGGLLEQALGRRQVVQMDRVGQLNPFLGRCGAVIAASWGNLRAGMRPARCLSPDS
jgi:hypothetical protein